LNERYLFGASLPHHAAFIQRHHLIADLDDFIHVMRDVQERNAGSLPHRFYFLDQARASLRQPPRAARQAAQSPGRSPAPTPKGASLGRLVFFDLALCAVIAAVGIIARHWLKQTSLSRHKNRSNPSPESCFIRPFGLARGFVQFPQLSVDLTVGLIRIDQQRCRHVIARNGRKRMTERRISRAALELSHKRQQNVAAIRFLPRFVFVIWVIATPPQSRIVSVVRHATSRRRSLIDKPIEKK
jgi:hypothetical protein